MPSNVLLETTLGGLPVRRGKVRDVYDLGEKLLIVASDRISAFDWVMPNGIPDKGRILTQLSLHWFALLKEVAPNHLIEADLARMNLPFPTNGRDLEGRTMLVRKAKVIPIECVVRGYLAGSGWKEYQKSTTICDIPLPSGLVESDRLPDALFTPATKAESGHDENISFEQMARTIGRELAEDLRRRSTEVYRRGAEYAAARGLILADTKFEWGHCGDDLILIDEVLTPDSSRFWPASQYQPGRSQPSFDKQYVRDWLESTSWDKNSVPPALPPEVVEKTRAKYVEAFERIAGRKF